MRLLLQRARSEEAPGDDELAAYLERNRERFVRPVLLSFRHVFLASTRRGEHVVRDAGNVLHALRSRALSDAEIADLSDPFALGLELRAVDRSAIARFFGDAFAEELARLEIGTWSGPIRSPFGTHLVRVEQRVPERMPTIDAVRQQISRAVIEARAAQRLRDELTRLRASYAVRVDAPAGTSLAKSLQGWP
jgi:hypothetical protein